MKKIGFLLVTFFLFASFSSDSKQAQLDFIGKWTVSDPKGKLKEFIFYEGHYVKMISVKQTNSLNDQSYSYGINWNNDPFILVIELHKSEEGDTVGDNKLTFALKIIDDNHIMLAFDRGAIRQSSFTKNETMTLTRQ